MNGPNPLSLAGRRFRDDTRSVSPVIGAVLMLALGIMLLTILQTMAIPNLNAQVEFEHNQQVQADMIGLETAADLTATTGQGETVRIDLGVRYPPRLLFVNPPPASGSLRTTEPGTVRIENARAGGETGDYWDGTVRTVETQHLVYTPDYNEYDGAPTTVYEPWAVYNRIGDRTLPKTETDLVDGRRISLVAVDGEYAAATAETVGVDVAPTSAPVRTVTVSDDGQPIQVTVPTRLRQDTWEDLLADELDRTGTADDRYVSDISCLRAPPAPCEELTITLEAGSYEMRLGEVAVGSGASQETATYLTDVEGTAATIPEGGSQRLVVEVRDRYDNPVSGVDVSAAVQTGGGTVTAVQPVTDERGRAVFRYDAPDTAGDVQVATTFGGGDTPAERAVFDIGVVGTGGGGTGTTGGDIDQGTDSEVFVAAVSEPSGPSSNVLTVSFRNGAGTEKRIVAARFVGMYDGSISCPCPTRLRIGASNNPLLVKRGSAQRLNTPVSLPGGATTGVTFEFRSNEPATVTKEDFLFVRLEFGDGTSSLYAFQLSPENP